MLDSMDRAVIQWIFIASHSAAVFAARCVSYTKRDLCRLYPQNHTLEKSWSFGSRQTWLLSLGLIN